MTSKKNIVEKLYVGILTTAVGLFCSMSTHSIAQGGPNNIEPEKQTKIVRGCKYEVLSGLAEITSLKISQLAAKSLLKYDEHEVLFSFTPMEGGDVLDILKNAEIEFVLRSRATRIPVGPEYIKQKNLKVGTRYAMDLLQTKNKEACLERYTYESKALDNDLFEAEDNIIPFMKERYATEAAINEANYIRRKEKGVTVLPSKDVSIEVADTKKHVSIVDLAEEEGIDITKMTEGELRAYTERKLRENGGRLKATNDYEIDQYKIRRQIKKEMYEKYEDHLSQANNLTSKTIITAKGNVSLNKNIKATALRKARQGVKEKERLEKLEADSIEKGKLERAEREKKIRARIIAEEEAKILAQIEAAKVAAQKRLDDEVERVESDRMKMKIAMDRLREIEKEVLKEFEEQAARKQCVFGERISGTIEVVKVSKAKNEAKSHLEYTEYQVWVQFRPDNYTELSHKDKKSWESLYTFTLDPKSINANPGGGYIRKYKVFKASKYQGFAQSLESGMCNSIIFYSPDLPIDASKIKLR